MTIRQNIERILGVLGIQGVEIFADSQPDRVFAWDTEGQLAAHCKANPEHWMADKLDPLHGASMRSNYREKAKPSMQCVEHAISQINHPNLPNSFWEIDFDEEAPTNPATIAEHLGICVIHAIRHTTTNEDEISRGLDVRLAKETTNV